MVEVANTATIAIKADTTDLERGEASLQKLYRAGEKTENRVGKLNRAFRGSAARNFAQQMSQVSQQTAASGDFVRALSIQLPDLALGFGAVGIAIGALAPILIGVGREMFSAAGDAGEFEEALAELGAETEKVDEKLRLLASGLSSLKQLRVQEELNRLYSQRNVLVDNLARGAGPQHILQNMERELELIEAQIQAGEIELEQSKTKIELLEEEEAARERILSLAAAQAKLTSASMVGSGRGGDPRDFMNPDPGSGMTYQEFLRQNPENPIKPTPGIGAVADLFVSDLDALQQELMTEREILDEWYLENQELLNDRRAEELLGKEAHNEAKLRLDQEYHDRLHELEGASQGITLGTAADLFSSLAKLSGDGHGKLFKIAKAFGIANALLNTYEGATEALKLPYPANIKAFRDVMFTGLGAVASMRSVSPSGSASGGGVPSAAPEPEIVNEQTINISVVGSGGLSPDGQEIIEIINEALEDGGRIKGITVN